MQPQPSDLTVGAVRARMRAATPPRYSWRRHVALIVAFVAAALMTVMSQLGSISLRDAGALLGILLFLNLGEYSTHRWTMHRRSFPRAVHHRHVVEHHGFFTYQHSATESWADLRWVLFPWWALPLLVAGVAPFALLLALFSGRLAWLFLLAVTLYYGLYEILHTLAHLPADHRWAGHPTVQALTLHHRVHHDPALMRRYNFNFVVPLFDRVFGTTFRACSENTPCTTKDTKDTEDTEDREVQ
ncbi:MAG TPA: sterol desaturase family protein [Terriglobales bacterium]|nr:sterol desaturase family protein [Terriglobales bacterium]